VQFLFLIFLFSEFGVAGKPGSGRSQEYEDEAPPSGPNGTQAGSLCYINAVALSLQVHGDSPRMALGDRSTVQKANVASIGFQPVFCSHVVDAF
jgi:hypothetical protein